MYYKISAKCMQRLNETHVIQRRSPIDEITSKFLTFENEGHFSDWLDTEMKTII
ncbi:hypothetical protein K3495_g5539 [Podosphaera aphanis]|nr:hypothetical protein K3495_g5539 [Podosphaera aphanis]